MAQVFRRKSLEVEAVRVADVVAAASSDWSQLPDFVAEAYEKGKIVFLHDAILITTAEGHMRGESSDWLIKDMRGQVYPCAPDTFAAAYEPVADPNTQQVVAVNISGQDLFDALRQRKGYGYGHDSAS